jgi:RimJ/RimL family protein N-acetyltransferase
VSLRDQLRRVVVRRTCHLVALDRIEDLVDGPPPDGVEIRPVTAADVDRVRDFRDDAVAAEFRRLLAARHRGVYAWHDGRVVGHFWAIVCREGRCRMWGGVDVAAGEALLAWGNVREDLRGRGLFQAMIRALTKTVFREENVKRVLADLPTDPPASFEAHRRCGFRSLSELSYATVCGVVLRRRLRAKP